MSPREGFAMNMGLGKSLKGNGIKYDAGCSYTTVTQQFLTRANANCKTGCSGKKASLIALTKMLTAKKSGEYIFLIRCGLEVSVVVQRQALVQKKLEKNKNSEIIRGNRCPFLMQT